MLQEKLRQDLNSIYFSGQTLNLEEQMNINLSLLKLHENENFDEVNFWGKIRGVYKDYYIAQTLNFKGHLEFPHIRFFWCTAQTWLFAELPNFSAGDEQYISRFNNAFSGEHDRVLIEAPPLLPVDTDSLASADYQVA
jgi:radial spoke head protein 9